MRSEFLQKHEVVSLQALSLAQESGFILSLQVGKDTDAVLRERVFNSDENTDCKMWHPGD